MAGKPRVDLQRTLLNAQRSMKVLTRCARVDFQASHIRNWNAFDTLSNMVLKF